ncbi:MAG: B12-binding domain-containing radical SAM protein [Euryarchaeota archaeon]|nr:B12-binding domain-containing radical SAM protein [Euryarchaeota archaeon]
MTHVLLIYPYFKPKNSRSIFRFPPLGICYVAASLQRAGHDVDILDCTFMTQNAALDHAVRTEAEVVGIYSMITMQEESVTFARHLRSRTRLLVAGGPLPSCDPQAFLDDFDVVVMGEGERTMVELVRAYAAGDTFTDIAGIAYRNNASEEGNAQSLPRHVRVASPRPLVTNLDELPFPARQLLPNDQYVQYGRKTFGYSKTTVITTRGCPFRCEFCSNAVFGVSYRERSAANVVDEVEQALSLGYDYIHFADDVFTFNRERLLDICAEIKRRGLSVAWECLGRVDSMSRELASAMKNAGCRRVFFGIESGNDTILKLMNKRITVSQARAAITFAQEAGLNVGAFFIVCYPGETNETVLDTLRFASSLPLDYLSFTMPYPLPNTALHERVKDRINKSWRPPESGFLEHICIFDADFSETKMKFAIVKGQISFLLKRRLRHHAYVVVRPFEAITDFLFQHMK